MKRIHRVAILGAGTMGARIAAHFANAGVPSLLLDIVPTNAPPDRDAPPPTKSRLPDSTARASQNRRLLRSLAFPPRYRGQFRRRPEEIGRCRLDHRGHRRKPRHQTLAAKESGGHPQARHHRHHQHQRASRGKNLRGIFGRLPPLLVWHPLLQSAALHAPA